MLSKLTCVNWYLSLECELNFWPAYLKSYGYSLTGLGRGVAIEQFHY